MKTILVLAANPKDTSRLRLDQEVREINNGLQRAQRRDEFILREQWATRPIDVRRAMLDCKPNIVHFCGHGAKEDGIAFEDDLGNAKLVRAEALAGLFDLFSDSVECVLLNACYSEIQAKEIARHIDYVLGMKKEIGDTAAIEFSVAFYDALGAGKSFEFAFRFACNAIQMAGISGHLTPELMTKSSNEVAADRVKKIISLPKEMERELNDFNSFYSGWKRTGITVHIYWHETGLTLEDANSIKGELEREGIPSVIMQHRDPNLPDSIFIGALVSAREAEIVLSKVPYQIQYIFPVDYPRSHGGDPNGLLIGMGYMSTHSPTPQMKETIPIKVSKSNIASLTERGISNVDFQSRLRSLTFSNEPTLGKWARHTRL